MTEFILLCEDWILLVLLHDGVGGRWMRVGGFFTVWFWLEDG